MKKDNSLEKKFEKSCKFYCKYHKVREMETVRICGNLGIVLRDFLAQQKKEFEEKKRHDLNHFLKLQRGQLIREFMEIVGEDERMSNLKGDFKVNWLNWVITNPKGWRKMGRNQAKQEIRIKMKKKYEEK